MDEERDFVVFTDDDGKDFELDVIDYFDYNGKEYAILIDNNEKCGCKDEECDCKEEECNCNDEECDCEDDCDCDCEASIYIMQIITNEEEDTEEFVSPADEDMDALIEIVQARLEEGDCDCDEADCAECDCEECKESSEKEEKCTCGCHKE